MNVERIVGQERVDTYRSLHDEARGGDVEARRSRYMELVNSYYDLVTDFYQYGWGNSFHFSERRRGESFDASILRHERRLATALRLAEGMEVADLGCGVGGPARAIAKASGASVVGVNNNAYQLAKAEALTREAGLADRVRFEKADFMALPFDDGTFDAAYAIEATCHAPDRVALFREIARVIERGGEFAGYEWCLTDAYDPNDAEHRRIKKDIEIGNGLPDLLRTSEIDQALDDAGFEVLEARDRAPESEVPWYQPLAGELSLRGLPRTPVGRKLTGWATRALERVRLAPKGSTEVSDMLSQGADALVASGRAGIFTPMYYFHARRR